MSQSVHHSTPRRGFTLVEILASMLLLSFGLAAAMGMVGYATNLSAGYQDRATALATAETVLLHHEPMGLTADSGDADGDGWEGNGIPVSGIPSSGGYSFTAWGWFNGYYVEREERSDGELLDNDSKYPDIVHANRRYATITVRLYSTDGGHLTTIRRRLLRRMDP